MNRANPATMRKAMKAADVLAKQGILFVPIPVMSEADHTSLLGELMQRLTDLEKRAEEDHDH